MARYWACVQTQTPLPAEDAAQAKLLYPVATDMTKTATAQVEEAMKYLKLIKGEIKALEKREDQFETVVRKYMENSATLTSIDGSVLATWKNDKPSRKFDAKLFQEAMPDIYQKFVREVPGARKFLVK